MEKNITAKWYEVKIQYDKAMEDGREKKVKEVYCFDALSFTEAESAACSEVVEKMDLSSNMDIVGITIAKYSEVFLDDEAEKFYKVTVKLVTLDEKTGNEKFTPVVHLVQANSTEGAEKRTKMVYEGTMNNYIITDINESKVLEIYPHHNGK